jgi:uncharacterized protein (DUF2141 family)
MRGKIMRRKLIFVLGILFLMEAIYAQVSNSTKLTIQVQGIKSKTGSINVAMYKSDSDFKQEKYAYKKRIPASSNGIVIFDKIEYGNYGIAVFHDENDNFKLDHSFVGMPSEGYGFSNNAKGSFGPPGFKDTSVQMNQGETNLSIKLNY